MKLNIYAKLLLPSLLAFAIFTLAIHFVWAPKHLQQQREQYITEQKQVAATMLPELERSLLASDYATLYAFLDGQKTQHQRHWLDIALFNASHQRLYPLAAAHESTADVVIQQPIYHEQKYIGVAQVTLNWEQKRVSIDRDIANIEFGLIALFLFFSSSGFIANVMVVNRPLKRLTSAAVKLADGDFNTRLPRASSDEIGQLTRSFDKMRHALGQAMRSLEASEARQRAVIRNMSEAVITINPQGIVEDFNPAAEKIFGYRAREIIGNNIALLTGSEHRDDHDRYLATYLRTGIQNILLRERELIATHKDGHDIEIALNVSEIKSDHLHLFCGVIRDITARKQYERALKQAKEEAEEASRVKSQFLANVSHEIRTPMNGVLGMAQLLAETALEEQQKEYLNVIINSGNMLLGAINDILDFSKIETGKMELDESAFDLEQTAYSVTQMLLPRAEEKGIEALFNFSVNCPRHVIGDVGRLRQVMIDLYGNAIKFTEQGHVILDIRSERIENNRVDLNISIRDTGIGISTTDLAHLFSSFSQADTSSTRRFGGTGLGLAISKQLVELMGGHIELTSQPGIGSSFVVSLSLQLAGEDTPTATPVNLQGKHALVVDDNPVQLKILEEQLQHAGMTVVSADSAQHALDTLETQPPESLDVAIIDHRMPDMDGEQLGKRLLQHPKFKHLPLILITSASGGKNAHDFKQLGFSEFLTKPIQREVLAQIVKQVISHNEPAAKPKPA